MTPDAMLQELANELKDVIRNLDEAHLRKNPEEEFVELAARLLIKLNRKALTLTQVPSTAEQAESEKGKAAQRIFDIFTAWMRRHPERSYETVFGSSGKFEIVMRGEDKALAFFQGESIQDAYAQAATALSFNEGLP